MRKGAGGNRDVAFQHARIAITHLGCWFANRHRARDVGCAIFILRAGIDQEEALAQFAIRSLSDAVMHNRAIRPHAGNGGEGNILQLLCGAAECFERLRGADLGLFAFGRFPCEPAEELCDCNAIAQMRSTHAAQLRFGFTRFHIGGWVWRNFRFATCSLKSLYKTRRCGGGIKTQQRFVLPQLLQGRHQRLSLCKIGKRAQRRTQLIIHFARIYKDRRFTLMRHKREAERDRRMRDIRTADVEHPCNRMRIAQHQSARFADMFLHAREFGSGRLAREFLWMQPDRCKGWSRAILPDGIDRIGFCGH